MQAHQALLLLGLGQTPLLNKLLLWDGVSMQQRLLKYSRDNSCEVCSGVGR
jgi:adenylyltransferase/sulfurtransferase